ncbi:MAG: hypothetical protein LBD45_03430 [Bacteroidales bacterium]|jgi:hypothetical protein|nr:hypothetical protein [Bacteroidales bacterium]
MKTSLSTVSTILVIVFFVGCKPVHITLTSSGEHVKDAVIRHSMLDFSTSCKLYKQDSIFAVSFVDSVYSLAFDREASRWYTDTYHDDLVLVTISPHRIATDGDRCCDQFLYTAQTTVGSKGKLPSRHIEKDGKLFYWWDKEFPLSEEMIAVLWKYNLLCDDTAGWIGFPDFSINEKLKGAHYYYSRQNLSTYKRVVTNIAEGYYKPPKLK